MARGGKKGGKSKQKTGRAKALEDEYAMSAFLNQYLEEEDGQINKWMAETPNIKTMKWIFPMDQDATMIYYACCKAEEVQAKRVQELTSADYVDAVPSHGGIIKNCVCSLCDACCSIIGSSKKTVEENNADVDSSKQANGLPRWKNKKEIPWTADIFMLSWDSKGYVEVKPQIKIGMSYDQTDGVAADGLSWGIGLSDVRDGIEVAAEVKSLAKFTFKADNIPAMQKGLKDKVGKEFEEDSDTPGKLETLLGYFQETVRFILGRFAGESLLTEDLFKEEPQPVKCTATLELSMSLGVSGKACFGWADTGGYHMKGCAGKVAAAIEAKADFFYGTRDDGAFKLNIAYLNFGFTFEVEPGTKGDSFFTYHEEDKNELKQICQDSNIAQLDGIWFIDRVKEHAKTVAAVAFCEVKNGNMSVCDGVNPKWSMPFALKSGKADENPYLEYSCETVGNNQPARETLKSVRIMKTHKTDKTKHPLMASIASLQFEAQFGTTREMKWYRAPVETGVPLAKGVFTDAAVAQKQLSLTDDELKAAKTAREDYVKWMKNLNRIVRIEHLPGGTTESQLIEHLKARIKSMPAPKIEYKAEQVKWKILTQGMAMIIIKVEDDDAAGALAKKVAKLLNGSTLGTLSAGKAISATV